MDAVNDLEELKQALALMTAGREIDQADLRRCIVALDAIAQDYNHLTREDMVRRAADALCDIGIWKKVDRTGQIDKAKGIIE